MYVSVTQVRRPSRSIFSKHSYSEHLNLLSRKNQERQGLFANIPILHAFLIQFHKNFTEWLYLISNGPLSRIPGGIFILGKEDLDTQGYYLGEMTA